MPRSRPSLGLMPASGPPAYIAVNYIISTSARASSAICAARRFRSTMILKFWSSLQWQRKWPRPAARL